MGVLDDRRRTRGIQIYDPVGERAAAARQQQRAMMPRPAAPQVTGTAADRVRAALAMPTPEEEEDDGGDNPFGRGLGFLINNPVTQTALKPLQVLDYGRRLATLGAEEFSELVGGREFETKFNEDGTRSEFGKQSNWDKLKDPEYGVGELLGGTLGDITPWEWDDQWVDRAGGFVGDVALDPLTYLSFGAGTAAGKLNRAQRLTKLQEAQRAAEAAGDAARIAELGGREALERIGQRGLGVANAAQNEAMGLGRQGVRIGLNPTNSVVIPRTEKIARGVNELTGAVRPLIRNAPGARALRATRSPKGFLDNDLNPALERIITGKGDGSIEAALEVMGADQFAREIGQGFGSVAKEELERVSSRIKDLSQEDISEMVRRAEELGETNIWTETADKMREVASFFGAELPELEGGRYAMPHILNRQFRNYIVDNPDDLAVRNFKARSGITETDLLEESGFLQRRAFRPNADGTPAVIPIGDTEVTIRTGSVDELNRVLKEAFPGYDGEIYEINPITAYRRYIDGVSRDVAKRGMGKRASEAGYRHIQNQGEVPETFNPVGFETVTDLEGNPTQRATMVDGSFEENQFYRGEVDEAATKARDEQIIKSQQPLIKQYREAAAGERENIARQMEADAQELLDPLREARKAASDRQRQALDRMRQAESTGLGAAEAQAEARAVIDEITGELDRLKRAEYNIKRSARSRTKTAQKRLLDDLDARRQALTRERSVIQSNYRSMMDRADESAKRAAKRVTDEAANQQRDVISRQVNDKNALDMADTKARAAWRARTGKNPPTRARAEAAGEWLKIHEDDFRRWIDLEEEKRTILRRRIYDENVEAAGQRSTIYTRDAQFASAADEVRVAAIDRELRKQNMLAVKENLRIIETRRQFEAELREATWAERGQLADATREVDDLTQAQRTAVDQRLTNQEPEVPAAAAAPDLTRQRNLVESNRGRDLEVARGQMETLKRQVGKRPSKASERRLRAEIRKKQAEIDHLERNGWGRRYDKAKQTIADAEATATPPIQRLNGPEHPLVQGAQRQADQVAASGEAIKGRLANEEIKELAANEAQQAEVAQRIGAISANADDEFTDIAARNRERAADRIESEINPQREALVKKQQEYDDFIEEMDAVTGDAQAAYVEAMQDEATMRAEHEKLAATAEGWGVSGKGGKPSRIVEGERGGRPSARAIEDVKAGEIPPAAAQPLYNSVEDMRQLLMQYPEGIDDELVQRIAASLFSNERQLSKLTTELDIPLRETERIVKAAKDGTLAPVIKARLKDDWRLLWQDGDIVVSRELDRMYRNLDVMSQNPKVFGRTLEAFTNFFKTYATLTPGFHIRNAMSAVFMNYADGVPSRFQNEGLRLWRQYAKSDKPLEFLQKLPKAKQDAFKAAFASGTGGRFLESGFADATRVSGRAKEKVFDNRATRLSQRVGQDWVEGPVRLSMALHSIDMGGDVSMALERISRIHFDYSQVSRFDEKAKRIIPFWTFMSRNLPMQITQMWTKPKLYNQYNSFIRNFKGEPEPGTPEYFDSIGAFRFGDAKLAGLPMFLQPDFAHTRLDEDIQKFEDFFTGKNMGRALTDVNPIFTAPIEYATGKDLFTGRQYEDTDLVPARGIVNAPLGRLAQFFDLTETGASGQVMVPEKFINLFNSVNPLSDRTSRVLPTLATGDAGSYEGRQVESIARLLGLPVRQLSPGQQQSTLRGQYYDQQDELAMQRLLARN